MKIGYCPTSADYSHPVDRRKACLYFHRRKLEFERAILGQHYDVVYISSVQTDIEGWLAYYATVRDIKNRPKLVFDLSDSYLSARKYSLKTSLRGTYRYLAGIASHYRPSFSDTLIEAVSVADAVVCGSAESRDELIQYNDNIHIIRDYFWNDIRQRKQSLNIQEGTLNVVWEGLSHGNKKIFAMLRVILSGLPGLRVNLHVITDWSYCGFGRKYFCKPTGALLQNIFAGSDVSVYYYAWNSATFSSLVTACDIALIPIPSNDPIMYRKPENKLILLWSAGIPVIATGTPSYRRVMSNVGLDWTCDAISEWRESILALSQSLGERENYMKKVNVFLGKECSEQRLEGQWDDLFASLKV